MVKAERLGDIRGFIGGLYGPDLHAKRVDALAGATLGVMTGASLAVSMIGQALPATSSATAVAWIDALQLGLMVRLRTECAFSSPPPSLDRARRAARRPAC